MQPQIRAALISGSTLFGISLASFISNTALSIFKVSYSNKLNFPNFFLCFSIFLKLIYGLVMCPKNANCMAHSIPTGKTIL